MSDGVRLRQVRAGRRSLKIWPSGISLICVMRPVYHVASCVMWPTKARCTAPVGTGSGAPAWNRGYFATLYVRAPAVFFDDSTLSPPLLAGMLTKRLPACRLQDFGQSCTLGLLHPCDHFGLLVRLINLVFATDLLGVVPSWLICPA